MQRLDRISGLIRRFLRWWAAELDSIGHECLTLMVPKHHRALTVFVDMKHVLIIDGEASLRTTLADIPYDSRNISLPETLPSMAVDSVRRRRVHVVMAAQMAFIRRVRLPLAARGHLKSMMSLQYPKLLPLDAALLFTDFKILASEFPKQFVDIDLAALKRSDVEPFLERIRGWGFRIASLHVGKNAKDKPRFQFSIAGAGARESYLGRLDRLLIGCAASLGLACTAIAATETYRAKYALGQAKELTSAPAESALSRRQQLLRRLDPLLALSRLEGAPTAAALVADITERVPHDTWLTTFELKEHHLRIVGLSPDSAGLVRRLSGSSLLSDVQLRSSMSVGIGTGKDRFEITAEFPVASP
jgi:general secretion pathway protein L